MVYSSVSSDDIMDYLSILMDQEFDMLIQDGSLESVSSLVTIANLTMPLVVSLPIGDELRSCLA